MTSIVGIAQDGIVYIGSDAAGSNYAQITTRRDAKVFRLGETLIGGCGSFRMLQLLRYAIELPKHPKDMPDEEWMVLGFVEACRLAFREGGLTHKESDQEYGGEFLVGYHGRLFHIEADFQVGESDDRYDACGSGEDTAKGVLYSTHHNPRLTAEERIILALEAGEHHNVGVRGPFNIMHLSLDDTAAVTEPAVPDRKESEPCNHSHKFLHRLIPLWRSSPGRSSCG